METLSNMENYRVAKLARIRNQYRALSRKIRTLPRRNTEMYVKEDVEDYLNINDLRSSYWVSGIRKPDGCFVLVGDGQIARWAEYFEQLFKLQADSLKLLDYR